MICEIVCTARPRRKFAVELAPLCCKTELLCMYVIVPALALPRFRLVTTSTHCLYECVLDG